MAARCRAATVAGLLAGAVAIGLLWASGRIDFPVYPPPGIINLLIGAALVGLTSWRWTPALGAAMGVVIVGGFLLSGGPPNLIGEKGAMVAAGNWVQVFAAATAIAGGLLATRAERR